MPDTDTTLYDLWKKQVEADLKGADFNEKLLHHFEEIEIRPLYFKNDLPEFVQDESSEFLDELETQIADETEDQGGIVLTWNICEEMNSDDQFLNDIVIASLQNGASYIRIKTTDWD